jgi:hypothetical protein
MAQRVGLVFADGRGENRNLALFANAYHDFNRGGAWQPYLGACIIHGDDTVCVRLARAGVT